MTAETQEHLIKRNPSLADFGVLTTGKTVHYFTESAVNRRPAGWRARGGDKLWVAEVGYGIYAKGVLASDPELLEFGSIDDLLNRVAEIPVQDDPYILSLIKKIHSAKNFKSLKVLAVPVHVSDLGTVIELPEQLRTQGSWFYLEPGQVRMSSTASRIELSEKIPGAVRLRVYQRLALETDRHIIDVDHFVPKSVGGPGNIEENLVPVSLHLNRAKRDRIPSGLFDVAANHDKLRHLVPPEFSRRDPQLLDGPQVRDAARKIVAQVNASSEMEEIRQFYQQVVDRHHQPSDSAEYAWRE